MRSLRAAMASGHRSFEKLSSDEVGRELRGQLSGLLTVVIFSFTLVMQEFVYGLTFITASSHFTISVGVPTFLVRGDVYFWGSLMGACFIASVPIGLLYNAFVDRFIAGFTVGAVKG